MYKKIKNSSLTKSLFNTKNLGLYVVLLIGLSVTWSTIKTIQKNYSLQRQIVTLQQSVAVQAQMNKNETLLINYYSSDSYLSLEARKYFNKALPGEKLILVPTAVSNKYIHQTAVINSDISKNKSKSKALQNWQDWVNFFFHKTPTS